VSRYTSTAPDSLMFDGYEPPLNHSW